MVFRARYDWWQLLVFGGLALMLVLSGLVEGVNQVMRILLIAMGLYVAWSLATLKYLVTERELVVAFGPFRQRYAWGEMVRVRKGGLWAQVSTLLQPGTRMAFSTRNILLEFQGSWRMRRVVISPREQERFLAMVQERAPQAVLEGFSPEAQTG